MYRHFATMTVAFTALIAFFANGEKETAVAAQASVSQPAPVNKKPALHAPVGQTSDDGGRWGSDDGGDFGHPTAAWFSAASGADGVAATLAPAVANLDDGDGDDPDAASDAAAALPPPSAAQIAAAQAASRLRSGTPTPSTD
jgi:hypothetical protein